MAAIDALAQVFFEVFKLKCLSSTFDKKKLVRAMQNYQPIKPNLLEKILEINFLNQSAVIVLFNQIFKWVTILFMKNTTR